MFKIKNKDLVEEITGEAKIFPKYTTQIINLANQKFTRNAPKSSRATFRFNSRMPT